MCRVDRHSVTIEPQQSLVTFRQIVYLREQPWTLDRKLYRVAPYLAQAASAYLESCFLASPVNLGLTSLIGISFIISLYMDIDISGKQLLGRRGSVPESITFLSINQRLKESFGPSRGDSRAYSKTCANLAEVVLEEDRVPGRRQLELPVVQ
ncbi:unnamed protein product [Timema podura]|uniref:Uncharacterized protein n=1 Tax=Timema podura TaxID=61482 RepID=A0ABN7P206_TIMPD|nr:unnamed protein product [Timema podura]